MGRRRALPLTQVDVKGRPGRGRASMVAAERRRLSRRRGCTGGFRVQDQRRKKNSGSWPPGRPAPASRPRGCKVAPGNSWMPMGRRGFEAEGNACGADGVGVPRRTAAPLHGEERFRERASRRRPLGIVGGGGRRPTRTAGNGAGVQRGAPPAAAIEAGFAGEDGGPAGMRDIAARLLGAVATCALGASDRPRSTTVGRILSRRFAPFQISK